ncbi:EamA family transporter RarD [Brevibacillus laterosporus]|uniref:EamA family transporter RarD n=1 Tax=Brevibacillus laterosporus TaxID=1465 RepID=UPI00215BF2C1|nr:EamA family transporter RarD [Brevibacillus laterosporus]MCR8995558.1 EamA family transporter RarD [Brevibacillus laterosporus]
MQKEQRAGILYAIVAYAMWGFLPIYWKSVSFIPPGEILAHRILWSLIFSIVLVGLSKKWSRVLEFMKKPKSLLLFLLASVLISANWMIYIWAVNAGHIVETSLGYYINPLLNVALGMLFFRERLDFWQLISLLFAAVGVCWMAINFGQLPWISLSLALSFGIYGVVKKLIQTDSITSLTLETVPVALISFVYICWLQSQGVGSFGAADWGTDLLLIGSGVATAMPLLAFASAAQRISLSTLGFIQYLAPTIQLAIAVFLYKESFTDSHLLSFVCIWVALILYTLSRTPIMQAWQPAFFKQRIAKRT